MRRWSIRLLAVLFVASIVALCARGSGIFARAAEMLPRAYFPLVFKAEPVRLDDFQDQDPVWQTKFREAKDGSFFYRSGRLVGLIKDNRANSIAWPGWRPLADYKLEVDARFYDGRWLNGLGLVFAGNDDWTEYYAFMLSYNFDQHNWTVARAKPKEGSDPPDIDFKWLTDFGWGGAPSFVAARNRWNHLMVVRVGNTIEVYINGYLMPDGTFTDGTYGRNRLVGVLVSSYEWSVGDMEFDNFQLTPLSMP
jgi:hypothetical protein